MSTSLPLHSTHENLNAEFGEVFDRPLPLHYGSPPNQLDEYEMIRWKAGLIDTSFRTRFRVTGKDRANWLHGQVTNDIKALEPGQGCRAALVSRVAKMLADLRIYRDPEFLEVDVWGPHEALLPPLEKVIIMDDVTLETIDTVTLSLQGHEAQHYLERLVQDTPLPHAEHEFIRTELAGKPVFISREDHSGFGGFDIVCEKEDGVEIWDTLVASDISPCGVMAWNTHRVEAGIPWYGIDMTKKNLPPETGIEDMISYTKGCYVGQEIIARMKTYGEVARRLCTVAITAEEAPELGTEIHSGDDTVGKITSVIQSPLGGILALAMVRKGHNQPGSPLTIPKPDGSTVPAMVSIS